MIRADLHTTLEQLIEQGHGLDELVNEIKQVIDQQFYNRVRLLNDEECNSLAEWERYKRFYISLKAELQRATRSLS